jgi:hypothetical protein
MHEYRAEVSKLFLWRAKWLVTMGFAGLEPKRCHIMQIWKWIFLSIFKVQVFFYAQLHVTTSIFSHKLGWLFGLVEWIQTEQYLDIKESDKHCFNLSFQHEGFLGSRECWLFPFLTLLFTSGIKLKATCLNIACILSLFHTKFKVVLLL